VSEASALTILEHHPFNAGSSLEKSEGFVPLAGNRDPETFARFGQALGAFHLEFKGAQLPGLQVRDAAWFSRAAPYVLAEVASLSERGEYELTMTQTGLLEEAGVMLAELSEPLTGLLSSFVHGNCNLSTAGFIGDRACLRDWSRAAKGLAWLDISGLSEGAEAASQDCLVALVSSYGEAADYPTQALADLIPFTRALQDLYTLDGWNTDLTSGARASGSVKVESRKNISRLIELAGA
jgi:hypothetical protein